MDQKNLERITEDTKIWTPTLDIVLSIEGTNIPNFREWVNWSGWKGYENSHEAYDFAAYLTQDGNVFLGLPRETPVRAIADGEIYMSSPTNLNDDHYGGFITIEHGTSGSGLFSSYHHVVPLVKSYKKVKKGEVIGMLYSDEGTIEGRLVHLHLELMNAERVNGRLLSKRERMVNPECIFSDIATLRAEPQGSPDFRVSGLQEQPEIYLANFKKLL